MEQRLFIQPDHKPVNEQYRSYKSKQSRNAYSDFQSEVLLTGKSVPQKPWSMKFVKNNTHPPLFLN